MDLYQLGYSMVEFKSLFLGVHLNGIILGFGGALCADFLFLRFINNGKISDEEYSALNVISQIIWIGLIVIIISGTLLFVIEPLHYMNSSKFLSKMAVVFVIVINGFLLNKLIFPKLTNIPFGEFLTSTDEKVQETRKLAFALGAVSTVSWWSAFSLGWVRITDVTLLLILATYSIALLVGVVVSQFLESMIAKRKINQPPLTG